MGDYYCVLFYESDSQIWYKGFYEADKAMRERYGAVYCRITEEETVWYGPSNPADNHSIGPVIGWHDTNGHLKEIR